MEEQPGIARWAYKEELPKKEAGEEKNSKKLIEEKWFRDPSIHIYPLDYITTGESWERKASETFAQSLSETSSPSLRPSLKPSQAL